MTTCWHRLRNTAGRYVVLSGEGRVEVGDLPTEDLSPDDAVKIPPNCPQRTTNTSTSADLLLLAVCRPRFQSAAYEAIEHLYR